MCGIVGCVGRNEISPLLLEGLSHLEYRGYDSAGIAVQDGNGKVICVRAKGKLERLKNKTNDGRALSGHIGIGHTRWATHGAASERNAHPIASSDGKVFLVHNGIIENAAALKTVLEKEGYSFSTETDSESAANLIASYYARSHDPLEAIGRACVRFQGSFALAILFADDPEHLYAARQGSPMVLCQSEDGLFAASDTISFASRIDAFAHMPQASMARIGRDSIEGFDFNLLPYDLEFEAFVQSEDATSKGGFEDYMLKEIFEQPEAIRRTIDEYLNEDGSFRNPQAWKETAEILDRAEELTIVGCGSAWHAGLIGRHAFEQLCHIPVRTELGSEYRSSLIFGSEKKPLIVISQSGETADTIESVRISKEAGVPAIAIVNVEGSALTRLADASILTKAGPEISVATTKAYSTQLIILYIMAMLKKMLAELPCSKDVSREDQIKVLLEQPDETFVEYVRQMRLLPEKIEKILEEKERVQWLAGKTAAMDRIFFLGRGEDYALSLEGALKIKEVSYIHSEAYAAGEMKHGTIALIEPGVFCVGVLMQDGLYDRTMSNLHEVKARGAYLIALTHYGRFETEDTADFTMYVPDTLPVFSPSLAIVPLQLFAYYAAAARGLDIDRPRNLAKSVTVE